MEIDVTDRDDREYVAAMWHMTAAIVAVSHLASVQDASKHLTSHRASIS